MLILLLLLFLLLLLLLLLLLIIIIIIIISYFYYYYLYNYYSTIFVIMLLYNFYYYCCCYICIIIFIIVSIFITIIIVFAHNFDQIHNDQFLQPLLHQLILVQIYSWMRSHLEDEELCSFSMQVNYHLHYQLSLVLFKVAKGHNLLSSIFNKKNFNHSL